MRRCHFCGKILHEIPFTCRHCKKIFCSDHHLPENHYCRHRPHHQHQKRYYEIPSNPAPINNTKSPNNYWKLFKEYVNLKNFTILSILLLLVGILPSVFSLNNYQELIQFAFEIGAVFFVLAYFLYAMKCWGATSKICAVLMITIPLLIYSLSITKISDSTINILFYGVTQFCIYAIFSIILLYLTEQVKLIIEEYVFKRTRRLHWYFTPKLSYSAIGVLVVSFLAVNYGGVALFSDNAASITQSLQNFNAPSTANLYASTPIPFPTPQIIPQTQRSTIIPTATPKLDFKQSPKTNSYSYVINGDRRSIGFTTYGGLSDYFSKESHSYYNDPEKEVIMELLENNYQNDNMQPLIEIIRKKSTNPNDQAKIAISLVQHMIQDVAAAEALLEDDRTTTITSHEQHHPLRKTPTAAVRRAASYHLARHYEGALHDVLPALTHYARAGCFQHCLRLAMAHELDGDVIQFALQSDRERLMRQSARYFADRGQEERARELLNQAEGKGRRK